MNLPEREPMQQTQPVRARASLRRGLPLAVLLLSVCTSATTRADFFIPPGDDPDTTPPTVALVDPEDGDHLGVAMLPYSATIDAFDDEFSLDDETRGISQVWLEIDGKDTARYGAPPFMVPIDVAPGNHVVRARAIDYEGNIGESDAITITVFAEGGSTSSGAGGDSSSGTAAGSESGTGRAESSGGGAPSESGVADRGCACALDGRASGGGLALLGMVMLGAVRRRYAVARSE